MKRFLFYFGYTTFMVIVLAGMLHIYEYLNEKAEMEFNILPLMRYGILYPVVFGVLFALPHLWFRYKEKSLKGFAIGQFLGVGLPSLYVMASPFLYYTLPIDPLPFMRIFMNQYQGAFLFSFIFGYLVIYCVRNTRKKEYVER